MKKIILLLLVMLSTVAYAQKMPWTQHNVKPKIEVDKINDAGERVIVGNQVVSSSAKNNYYIRMNLSGLKTKENLFMSLVVEFQDSKPLSIYDNSPFLVKHKDGTVSEYKVIRGDSDDVGTVSTLLGAVFTLYKCAIQIDLTDEFMKNLGKGIEKMRFEVNDDIMDVELKKDNLTGFLMEQYAMLMEAFEKERSFKDGF